MANQAEIFVAVIRAEFMPEDFNDDNYGMEP